MQMFQRFATSAAVAAALLGSSMAQAGTWNWSYTGPGVSASGTLSTAGNAVAPEDILTISGQRNGLAILGLVPLGTNLNFEYDNQFSSVAPYFSAPGMLFDVGGGDAGIVNVYFFNGDTFDLVIDGLDVIETPITFRVSAVPEAATVAQMGLGLAALALFMQRRRRSA